jgi:hypothetical protein
MKVQIRHVFLSVICVFGQSMSLYAESVPFSFDQLFPSTSISRALNAMRLVLSLGQDLADNQYDADTLRHTWLELYNASTQLVMQQETGRVLPGIIGAPLHISDDLREHMQSMWHHIGILYDQVQLDDVSIREFLHHMRIATTQIIDLL